MPRDTEARDLAIKPRPLIAQRLRRHVVGSQSLRAAEQWEDGELGALGGGVIQLGTWRAVAEAKSAPPSTGTRLAHA